MAQFDVFRNPSTATAAWAPYLVELQNDLLGDLRTVVVAPLVRKGEFGSPVTHLNPVLEIQGELVVLSTAELAGVARQALGEWVDSLAPQRHEIIAALDLLFTGIQEPVRRAVERGWVARATKSGTDA